MTSKAPSRGSAHGVDETLDVADARARMAGSTALLDRLLHDLKQPLNLLRIVAQDLRIDHRKQRLDLATLPDQLLEIERAVDEVTLRIDQVRTFGRPTEPRAPAGTVDVARACRAAIDRSRRAHPRAALTESLAADLPAAAIDAFALEQAVWEILDNAARAGEAAGGDVRVELGATLRDAQIAITVRDHGGGIPADAHARIFEPFFTSRSGAAGLGLSAALALVTEAAGTLRCTESGSEGTAFEILLPVSS